MSSEYLNLIEPNDNKDDYHFKNKRWQFPIRIENETKINVGEKNLVLKQKLK